MFWNFFKKKKKYKCSSCGEYHDELPALAYGVPDSYLHLSEEDKKEIAEISSDFCIIRHPEQTDRFIRTTMTIQINDACENFDYGIWVSVSEKTFDEYKSNFKKEVENKTYFGRICNYIPDYEESTWGLPVNVNTRLGGIRPEIIPHENPHKLVQDWEEGILFEEALKRVDNLRKK